VILGGNGNVPEPRNFISTSMSNALGLLTPHLPNMGSVICL
jgi:hypothetical protein